MIEITIDELVMRGLAPTDARTAAAALAARLAELARDGDTAAARRDEAFRRTASVVAPATEPSALGAAVAAAVWGAVSSGGGR